MQWETCLFHLHKWHDDVTIEQELLRISILMWENVPNQLRKTVSANAPIFKAKMRLDSHTRSLGQACRRAERRWKKDRLTVRFQIFKSAFKPPLRLQLLCPAEALLCRATDWLLALPSDLQARVGPPWPLPLGLAGQNIHPCASGYSPAQPGHSSAGLLTGAFWPPWPPGGYSEYKLTFNHSFVLMLCSYAFYLPPAYLTFTLFFTHFRLFFSPGLQTFQWCAGKRREGVWHS